MPKTDKAAILSDAVRMVTELRSKAQMLKETNDELLVKIKELKVKFCFYLLFWSDILFLKFELPYFVFLKISWA